MLEVDVVPGVHRVEDAYTNWYMIEEGGRLTVVDTGVPTSWRSFHDALARIGRAPSDVAAVVLTHGHFDHVGFAERARSRLGVPVWVHEADVAAHAPSDGLSARAYTGAQGPRIVAGAATAHSQMALSSLDALAATGAGTVLTGHGPPWRDGVGEAVRRARAAGPH